MKSNSSSLIASLLRWLADYGLSLSAADYVLPEERESACPFAHLLRPEQKKPV
ncbi:MAG: hypothetical protein K0Q76_967 [Panacagrimonas sp.]|jgi:hypothetical protein|nr:hypothetical protein [Panacagrimonas sp.]MCC2655859.1 hypothetical protein [Panacagrimonas sp.]